MLLPLSYLLFRLGLVGEDYLHRVFLPNIKTLHHLPRLEAATHLLLGQTPLDSPSAHHQTMYQKISERGWILFVVSHRVQEEELLLSPRCVNHLFRSGSSLLHVHLKSASRALYAQSLPLPAKLPPHPKPTGIGHSSISKGSTHQLPPIAILVSPVSTTPSYYSPAASPAPDNRMQV